ncbi:MAG: efflux RND transporter permease subunit [Myxococcota bacterium]
MSEALLRHRAWVVGVLAWVTLLLAAGTLRLETDVGYRAFLGAHHPAVETLDAFLARYGGGLTIHALWSCEETPACESATDAASLGMAADVAAALEGRPGVRRVIHPGNAPLLVTTLDGLAVRTLLADGARVADADALAARALADPTWRGELVSADGRVGALVVELTSSSSRVASQAYAALDAALAAPAEQGFVFHRVGGPVEFVVAGAELDAAMAKIVPVMVALVALGLFALLRSAAATAAALATVGVAVLWTLGAMGWLGWAKNSLSQTLPPLVLVIGVCDGIHLITRYTARCLAQAPRDAGERRRTLARAMSDVWRPCLLTTVTTAAGFASFAVADLTSFVRFGLTAAFGVSASLLLTFSLLPIALAALPASWIAPAPVARAWSRGLLRLSDFSLQRARPIVALAVVLGSLGAVGFARLRVDSSFEDLYGRDSDVVAWTRFASEKMTPSDRLEIDLALPGGLPVGGAEVQRVVGELGRRIARNPELGEPRSFLSRPHWRQELLAASGGPGGIGSWVDLRDRHVRLSFAAEKLPQDTMRALMADVRWALDALPAGFAATATGPFAVVNDMVEAIRATQLQSFATALVAVWLLLAASLGSLRWALLAMVPTALPVVITLGAMGLLGLPLDVGSAMVGAVVLGVAVDDTIHVLERFRLHRGAGAAGPDAIARAIHEVGQPLVSTSVALAVGFAALALSPWRSVASFGLVSGVAILSALLAVLLVLPALVSLVGGLGGSGRRATPAAAPATGRCRA